MKNTTITMNTTKKLITGATPSEYMGFLEIGGHLTVQIDRECIKMDSIFENSAYYQYHQYSGFELPPLNNLSDLIAKVIYQSNDEWARVLTFVYRNGGRIIYHKIDDDKYEAAMELPLILGRARHRRGHFSCAGRLCRK